jgi:predicted dehydrogenase/ribosomal protein S18 acetylase RimI-like enzyme
MTGRAPEGGGRAPGTGAAARGFPAREEGMQVAAPRLRVGIVGRRGVSAAAGLVAAGAEVAALCDADAATLGRMGVQMGLRPARLFPRFEDLLASDVDAVVVATPMHLHAPQAAAALDAGKHVLSEVTAAVSWAQCRDLLAAARRGARAGRLYMMAENYCYSRQNVLVRALVEAGAFGSPYYGEGEYIHDVKGLHHNPDGSPTWRARWQVGVNGCTYGTHSLGPVMQWLGREPIATVTCLGSGVHTDPEHAIDDSVVMLCKLASGRLARVRLDMMSNRPHATTNYTLQGTAGCYESARAPGERDRIWLQRHGEARWHDLGELAAELPAWYREGEEAAAAAGHGGGDFFVARDFVRACRGEIANPVPVADAVAWTAAGLCSQESIARGGMPVAVPPIAALDPPASPDRGGPEASPQGPQLVMRLPAGLAVAPPAAPPGYVLRRADAGDAAALARCMDLAFGGWDAERVRAQFLEAPDVQSTFVAVDGSGRVVACASHREVPERFPGATYLHWVAADPCHAGHGLGAAVSAAVVAFGRAAGARDAVLETDDHRLPAIATYLGLGFAPEYRHPGHPGRWAAVLQQLAAGRRQRSGR